MKSPRSLLVVDKKRGALHRLVPGLVRSGYRVSFCDSAAAGEKQARANPFAAILLGRDFAALTTKLKRHSRTQFTPLLLAARPERSAADPEQNWPADDLLFPPLTLPKLKLRLARAVKDGVIPQSEMPGREKAERNASQPAQSSRRLEALFAYASDGILVVDRKGIITDLNEIFVRMSGYAKAEAQGRSLDQVLLPETERARPLSRLLRGVRVSSHANARLRCRDHSERLLTAHFQLLPGPQQELLISLLDMTEERQLGLELRRTKEFLEKVIQGTMDAIIAADLLGNVLLFNEGAERISGYRAEAVIGKVNIVDLYAPGVARDVMRKLRSPDYGGPGKLETCSNTLLGKNGEEIPINMSASIIYEDGREIASVSIFHDLRDRIKIEKELREAQERLMESRRREALVALAGAAAHQLNQPLTSILGYAEILKRVERSFYELAPHHPALASLKNAVKAIAESAERMATVVRKIGETAEFKTQVYLGGTQIVDLDRAGGERVRELPEAAYLESVLELSPEAVLVIGEDTIINRANPAARALMGEEPAGFSFTRYLQGTAHVQGMSAFEQVRQGRRTEFELELTRPATGERRLTRNLGIPIPGRNEFLALFRDVTAERRDEQERQWLASFQGQILEAAEFPVLTLDLDGRITFWNHACERLFGSAAAEMRGQRLHALDPAGPEGAWAERLHEWRRRGRDEGQLELRRRDGALLRMHYLVTLLRSEPGEALGYCLFLRDAGGGSQSFVAIGQDLTRLRQLEAQLLHSEKLASLGQMAASIAHELNNPLTAISSYTQIMLRAPAGLSEKTRERMQRILEESNRIESLVKNLMSYARPSAGEMVLLHLGEVIQQALTFSRYQVSKGNVHIVSRIPEDLPLVRGVRDQLQQVFINLLTNASYACAQKGGGQVKLSTQVAGPSLEVLVADTGTGIRPEDLDQIFEPFFTTKSEGQGTGLGLSIVKDIIARHRGQVRVQSRFGEGAEFIISLPLAGGAGSLDVTESRKKP